MGDFPLRRKGLVLLSGKKKAISCMDAGSYSWIWGLRNSGGEEQKKLDKS
jgi:hypothetical protein